MTSPKSSIPATLIPGDGIGPEIVAAAMMLDHVGATAAATKLRNAINGALREDNVRTGDLGGEASTRQLTQAIVRRLG